MCGIGVKVASDSILGVCWSGMSLCNTGEVCPLDIAGCCSGSEESISEVSEVDSVGATIGRLAKTLAPVIGGLTVAALSGHAKPNFSDDGRSTSGVSCWEDSPSLLWSAATIGIRTAGRMGSSIVIKNVSQEQY